MSAGRASCARSDGSRSTSRSKTRPLGGARAALGLEPQPASGRSRALRVELGPRARRGDCPGPSARSRSSPGSRTRLRQRVDRREAARRAPRRRRRPELGARYSITMHAGRSPAGARATSTSGTRRPDPACAQRAQPRGLAQEEVRRAVVVPLREPVAARGAQPHRVVDAAAADRARRRSARARGRRAPAAARARGSAARPSARAARAHAQARRAAAGCSGRASRTPRRTPARSSSTGPARRAGRRGLVPLPHQPDAVAQRRRAAPTQIAQVRSGPSPGSGRSARSRPARTSRAIEVTGHAARLPRRAAPAGRPARPRGSRACPPSRPRTRAPRPACSAWWRKIASASGERQMLPVQTKSSRRGCVSPALERGTSAS